MIFSKNFSSKIYENYSMITCFCQSLSFGDENQKSYNINSISHPRITSRSRRHHFNSNKICFSPATDSRDADSSARNFSAAWQLAILSSFLRRSPRTMEALKYVCAAAFFLRSSWKQDSTCLPSATSVFAEIKKKKIQEKFSFFWNFLLEKKKWKLEGEGT